MSKSLQVTKIAWNALTSRIINSIYLVVLAPVKKGLILPPNGNLYSSAEY